MVRVEDERDVAQDIVEFLESVPYCVALFFHGRPSSLDRNVLLMKKMG